MFGKQSTIRFAMAGLSIVAVIGGSPRMTAASPIIESTTVTLGSVDAVAVAASSDNPTGSAAGPLLSVDAGPSASPADRLTMAFDVENPIIPLPPALVTGLVGLAIVAGLAIRRQVGSGVKLF